MDEGDHWRLNIDDYVSIPSLADDYLERRGATTVSMQLVASSVRSCKNASSAGDV